MRRLTLLVAVAAGIATMPAAARAQNSVLGSIKWVGVGKSFPWYWRANDPAHPTQFINNHVYGGAAYAAQFKFNSTPGWAWPPHGTGTFGPTVDIFCVDFTHKANTGTYSAYFTNLGGNLTYTRDASKTKYLQVAWLATKMNTYSLVTTAGKTTRAEIHAAMWWILSGQPKGSWNGLTSNNGPNNAANYIGINANEYWVKQAGLFYNQVNAYEWTVVTDKCVTDKHDNLKGEPTVDTCSQEFLVHTPPVPEPATIILLGTGLLATLAMSGAFKRPPA